MYALNFVALFFFLFQISRLFSVQTRMPLIYQQPGAMITDPTWYPYQQMVVYQVPQGYISTPQYSTFGPTILQPGQLYAVNQPYPSGAPGRLCDDNYLLSVFFVVECTYKNFSLQAKMTCDTSLFSPFLSGGLSPGKDVHTLADGSVVRSGRVCEHYSSTHPTGLAMVRPIPQQVAPIRVYFGSVCTCSIVAVCIVAYTHECM